MCVDIEWQHLLLVICCIFWLFVYFFLLGPFLVWYTGASDLDVNATTTSKPTPNNSPPRRSDQSKRERNKNDFY